MLPETLIAIFRRDLATLRHEVQSYTDEAAVWASAPGIPNSGGVLVRHICGNLQHFVGAILGRTGYRRDRDAEFTAPQWDRARLLGEIAATEEVVSATLMVLPAEALAGRYPATVDDRHLETGDFLVHLAVHCGFHLGQVDCHRRVVSSDSTSVAPMGIRGLASAQVASLQF